MTTTVDPRTLPIAFAPGVLRARRETTRGVVHTLDTGRDWVEDIRAVDAWHKARGWRGIGYHAVIWRDGSITQGRPADMIGAHTEGWNATSLAVALSGGKGADRDDDFADHYTPAQATALEGYIRSALLIWPGMIWCGHHDHPAVSKACPGFNVAAWCRARGITP